MSIKKISLKWKLLFISAIGPIIVSIIIIGMEITQIKKDNIDIMMEKSKSIVMMAESAREEMSKKLTLGLIKDFKDIEPSKILEAVPVISAINMARKNADRLNFTFRVPKFSPRNPENEPTPFEAKIIKEIKAKDLVDKMVLTKENLHYFKPIKLTQECLFCHGDPRGERDAVGGIKEGWKTGEIHGAFEIISSLDQMKQTIKNTIIKSISITAVIILIVSGLVWIFLKTNIINPITSIQSLLQKIGGGDLTGHLETKAEDELGIIADELIKTQESLTENIKGLARTSEMMNDSSILLENLSDEMSVSSEDTTVQSESVAAASEELSSNMESVAAAIEETSSNVSMVSNSAEEINQRISETAENTEKARSISDQAVQKANEATEEVNRLGEAAQQIGKTIELITEISEQTNLLALNATIESARARRCRKRLCCCCR